MSRKACLLTQNDVPQYIKEIVQRLRPVLIQFEDEDGNWWGYTFRLDAKWKCGYESQLQNDCKKIHNIHCKLCTIIITRLYGKHSLKEYQSCHNHSNFVDVQQIAVL